jgi:hypothetical protein
MIYYLKKLLNIINKPVLVLIITIFVHLIFVANYPVSVEFAFIDFAKYYEEYNKLILKDFTNVQANTIVLSYIIFFFDQLFLINNYLITGRLLSVLSYIFLYFSILNFINFFKINLVNFFLLVLLLFLNPIIWIYGFKVTADLLPASLCFFGISQIFAKKNIIYKILISSFFVSLGSLMKPMFLAIVVLGSFLINYFNSNKDIKLRIFYLVIYNFLPFISLGLYFYWALINLGFILSLPSDNYFDYNLYNFFAKFLYYLGITFIFIFPFSILDFNFKILKKYKFYFALLLFLFFIGYQNNFFPGELNLGNFFNINENILRGLYFLCSGLLLFHFYLSLKKSEYNKIYLYVIISFLCYIFALSFFRPTQRYLMLFIPFFYVVNILIKKEYKKFYYFYFIFILFFFLINICLTTYSHFRSMNALKTIDYLKSNSILQVTKPGPLIDSYNFYTYDQVIKKYQISLQKPEKYIKEFSSGFLFFKVNYYLSKV